jgi:glycerate kinase
VRALACPASLKGVLTAPDAAAALAEGLSRAGIGVEQVPLADGGEGTAAVLQTTLGGEWRDATVSDALGRPATAHFLLLPDGTAVVESAAAIGIMQLTPMELDPWNATSRGLGELVREALAAGPKSLLVCLGGVATVDGGAGLREVISELPVPTRVACDVRNTLLGDRGAARAFGPQKGATPELVERLEERLAGMEELAPYAGVVGAGAAGGLGAAFAALGAELVLGAKLVLAVARFEDRLDGIDIAITGEGTVDRATPEGKAPGEVARLCRERGIRCAVFGGIVAAPVPGAELYELSGDPSSAWGDLVELGERLGDQLAGG